MGKRSKRKQTGSPFILIELDLYDCSAFRSLSANAQRLYLFFRRKIIGRLQTAMLKELPLSYCEIHNSLRISVSTARKVILELDGMGFIDCLSLGGLRSDGMQCNVYRLSDRFKKWGDLEFVPGTMRKNFEKAGFGTHRKFRHEKKILKIRKKTVSK